MSRVWKLHHPYFFDQVDFSSSGVGSRPFDVRLVPFRFGDSGAVLYGGMPCQRSVGKHHCNRLVLASNTGRHKSLFGSGGRKQKLAPKYPTLKSAGRCGKIKRMYRASGLTPKFIIKKARNCSFGLFL